MRKIYFWFNNKIELNKALFILNLVRFVYGFNYIYFDFGLHDLEKFESIEFA